MDDTAASLASPSALTVRLYDSSTSPARGLKALGWSWPDWVICSVCSHFWPLDTSGSHLDPGLCSFHGTNWLPKMPESVRDTPPWTTSLLVNLEGAYPYVYGSCWFVNCSVSGPYSSGHT